MRDQCTLSCGKEKEPESMPRTEQGEVPGRGKGTRHGVEGNPASRLIFYEG